MRDDLAIIQTLDFFTPIVDEPYAFGQIAATNALSDIYAMGGVPLTAMNIICFPIKQMDVSVLNEILRGGLDKIKEAGAFLVGGHSVEDEELKYGLSVTGKIHPDRIFTNLGARAGDRLILTKPIGTGIINTAIKGNLADRQVIDTIISIMTTLNRLPGEALRDYDVSACTDVTGFGLLGHACEMIEDSPVGLRLSLKDIPVIEQVRELAGMGIVPGGTHRNKEFRIDCLANPKSVGPVLLDILFDPQTSGGLLVAVTPEQADEVVSLFKGSGMDRTSVIGEFISSPAGKIIFED